MRTTAAVRHILHRSTLLASVAGGLMMAFLTGATAHTLIATYGRDAAVAGEIAIPVNRLDLQGERLVRSGADDSTPDREPRRWQM